MTTEDAPARRRDADATRAALLAAATELFAERGFEQTTVRDIAAHAKVNQALLFRYFGSKDALFQATLASTSRQLIDETPPEQLVARMLTLMLSQETPKSDASSFYAVLRSSSHERAASAVRLDIGADYTRALAPLTDQPNADIRADLVLAWLLGIGLLRSVVNKQPLADADPTVISECVLRAVSVLLERSAPDVWTE